MVRQCTGERRRDERRSRCRSRRARHAALDPGEQGDEEEGRDVEENPLLDTRRQHRREGRNFEHEPDDQRDGCGDEDAQRTVERPSEGEHQQERRERHDPEVEVELGDVVEHPFEHRADAVVLVAGDAVASEHVVGRAAARALYDQHPDDGKGEHGVERAELVKHAHQPAAVEPGERDGRAGDGRDEHDRLRPCQKRKQAEREQHSLAHERGALEREHEREHDTGEDRIERGLRHQRARVHHRRDGDGEGGADKRPEWT